jgi:hypothetical protein
MSRFGHDLVAASLACRAWRAVALDLMNSLKEFGEEGESIERVICGLHLRPIVGLECYTIKHLQLEMEFVEKEYISLIARAVAPTLSSLWIGCFSNASEKCIEVLDIFFEECDGIRDLHLDFFDFGYDPSSISSSMKDGFNRLRQLDLMECQGEIQIFVESTPIPNLQVLTYESDREAVEEDEIVSSIASSYRTLTSVTLTAKFKSSDSLLKVVECCRCIERLVFSPRGNFLGLERSDILAITSLPHLCHLELYCRIAEDAYSSLTRCRGLKDIRIPFLVDLNVLSVVGRNLAILDLEKPSKEVVYGIVESCPNLHYLNLEGLELDEEDLAELKQSLKNGLKRLAKLKVNEESVRLGTDWAGYKWIEN